MQRYMGAKVMRRELRVVVMGCVIAALVLFGCGRPAPMLRVGTNIWPGYAPLYLAQELGYYPQQNIRIIEFGSATEVLRAFRNGVIEAAALTLDEALLLAQDDLDPRVILVMDVSLGADVVLGQTELRRVDELRGKRVGVENTAVGAYLLARALQSAGLRAENVTIVPLPEDEHESAFVERRVDAIVTFEPTRTRLLDRHANLLFDSANIPGEIMDVLVVRAADRERFAPALAQLLQGWFKALAVIAQRPGQAAEPLGRFLSLAPAQALQSFGGLQLLDAEANRAYLVAPGARLVSVTQRLAQVMREARVLTTLVDVARLPDASVLTSSNDLAPLP
jgi:NitT/TauT family transport system substrate-binding protein